MTLKRNLISNFKNVNLLLFKALINYETIIFKISHVNFHLYTKYDSEILLIWVQPFLSYSATKLQWPFLPPPALGSSRVKILTFSIDCPAFGKRRNICDVWCFIQQIIERVPILGTTRQIIFIRDMCIAYVGHRL